MLIDLVEFIQVANKQITGQGTLKNAKIYTQQNEKKLDYLEMKISFGVGRASAIPWIAFLGKGQEIKKGIYPVYLYYKEYNLLILAYGISESSTPTMNWNTTTSDVTIRNYFNSEFSKTPIKYGSSFISKIYSSNSLPTQNVLDEDLKIIIKKYQRLLETITTDRPEFGMNNQVVFDFNHFVTDLKKSGLIFTKVLSHRFTASLLTKPFVILTGLSGSGKTKLAQAFAQWISADESQYELVPVGADWTNREPLLGYPNALKQTEYVPPQNYVLDLMIRATDDFDLHVADNAYIPKPYFLILDEMNLSHVERYFADFLSTMESGDSIPLHNIEPNPIHNNTVIPKSIKLPKNLFIIGTVNIDETTYMFSPKVLDRANTLEFRLTEEDLQSFIDSDIKLDLTMLTSKGADMSSSFMSLALQKTDKNLKDTQGDLKLFFTELKKSGAEFGYRTAGEIGRLIYMLEELGDSGNNLLDIAIMQKLLPKLHGSRSKLNTALTTLAKLCVVDAVGNFNGKDEDFRKTYFIPFDTLPEHLLNNIKYKISFEKISRMHKNAIENGFTSYAEA